MSPKEASEFLGKLFSQEGIMVKGFKINAQSPFIANVKHEKGTTEISFGVNQPKASITKLLQYMRILKKLYWAQLEAL